MPATIVVGILLTSAALAGVGISALVLALYILRAHRGGWPSDQAARFGDDLDPETTVVLSGSAIDALDSFGNSKER